MGSDEARESWLLIKKLPAPPTTPGVAATPGVVGKTVISVPKRHVRLATRRSRLKRILRESLKLSAEPPHDMSFRVVVMASVPEDLKRQDVDRILKVLLRRIKHHA